MINKLDAFLSRSHSFIAHCNKFVPFVTYFLTCSIFYILQDTILLISLQARWCSSLIWPGPSVLEKPKMVKSKDETGHINTSFFTLPRVFRALGSRERVPYLDSKLTKALENSRSMNCYFANFELFAATLLKQMVFKWYRNSFQY